MLAHGREVGASKGSWRTGHQGYWVCCQGSQCEDVTHVLDRVLYSPVGSEIDTLMGGVFIKFQSQDRNLVMCKAILKSREDIDLLCSMVMDTRERGETHRTPHHRTLTLGIRITVWESSEATGDDREALHSLDLRDISATQIVMIGRIDSIEVRDLMRMNMGSIDWRWRFQPSMVIWESRKC